MAINQNVRNVVIVLAIAAVVAFVPGAANGTGILIQAISMAFLAALAWVGAVLYRQNRTTLYSLGDGRRAALYAALAVLAVTLTATPRLWHTAADRSPGSCSSASACTSAARCSGQHASISGARGNRLVLADRGAYIDGPSPVGHAARTLPAAVSKGDREAVSDWLMVLGAPVLFVSLFLTWSHQFSPAFLAQYANTPALRGDPARPDRVAGLLDRRRAARDARRRADGGRAARDRATAGSRS